MACCNKAVGDQEEVIPRPSEMALTILQAFPSLSRCCRTQREASKGRRQREKPRSCYFLSISPFCAQPSAFPVYLISEPEGFRGYPQIIQYSRTHMFQCACLCSTGSQLPVLKQIHIFIFLLLMNRCSVENTTYSVKEN